MALALGVEICLRSQPKQEAGRTNGCHNREGPGQDLVTPLFARLHTTSQLHPQLCPPLLSYYLINYAIYHEFFADNIFFQLI